jgi:hypothetical protein
MQLVFIEVTNGKNWGKFFVGRFDSAERMYRSKLGITPLLRSIGWGNDDIIVFDLQTCEGAGFTPWKGGIASADLNKHRVWVCPMFEPFLQWLYRQDLADLTKLPPLVELSDAEFQMYGYRREGKQ